MLPILKSRSIINQLCAKSDASIVKCSVVVNSLILTAALKGHSEERE